MLSALSVSAFEARDGRTGGVFANCFFLGLFIDQYENKSSILWRLSRYFLSLQSGIKTTYNYVDAKTDVKDGEIVLGGTFTCHISVIASKEGLEDSDPAEIDVELSVGPQGDVNHDGNVSITDAVSVVNQILNNE